MIWCPCSFVNKIDKGKCDWIKELLVSFSVQSFYWKKKKKPVWNLPSCFREHNRILFLLLLWKMLRLERTFIQIMYFIFVPNTVVHAFFEMRCIFVLSSPMLCSRIWKRKLHVHLGIVSHLKMFKKVNLSIVFCRRQTSG